MIRLKMWTHDRLKKFGINISETDSLATVLQKGCSKLGINGVQLVAEEDGTLITDEDDVLFYATNGKPVILLAEHEYWTCEILPEPSQSNTSPQDFSSIQVLTENDIRLQSGFQESGNHVNTDDNLSTEQLVSDDPMSANEPTNPQSNNSELNNSHLNNEDGQILPLERADTQTLSGDADVGTNLRLYLQDKKASFRSWNEYQIPWLLIPPSHLSKILSGATTDDEITSVVQTVIADMRFYNQPITFKDLKLIAIKFMTTFPQVFEDKQEDGSRLDTGYNNILSKLKYHNDYLNRPHKRGRSLEDALNVKLKDRRTLSAVRNGTINWQPTSHPEGENEQTLDEKRLFLKELDLSSVQTVTLGCDLETLLKETYPLQRLFLNDFENPPNYTTTMEMWPLLFNIPCLFWHFEQLTGVSIEKLKTNFNIKMDKLLRYGDWKFNLESTNLSEESKRQLIVEILARHFKETQINFLHTLSAEMEDDNIVCSTDLPTIIVKVSVVDVSENEDLGDTLQSTTQNVYTYLLFFYKKIILRSSSLLESLQVLIALYFVFNKTYSTTHPCTLLFIQMYLLNIAPANDVCRAKSESSRKKALNFFKILNKMDAKKKSTK